MGYNASVDTVLTMDLQVAALKNIEKYALVNVSSKPEMQVKIKRDLL